MFTTKHIKCDADLNGVPANESLQTVIFTLRKLVGAKDTGIVLLSIPFDPSPELSFHTIS